MGTFNRPPPNIGTAPDEYNRSFWNEILRSFRLYFQSLDNVQHINVATLNIDINALPTQTSLADLRSGDVYRDTGADNALKVKP